MEGRCGDCLCSALLLEGGLDGEDFTQGLRLRWIVATDSGVPDS